MANNNNESSLPTNPFHLSSGSPSLVFASTTKNDATPDQFQSSVSGGTTSVTANSSSSTLTKSSIFPSSSFPVQSLWGNSSSPFGGPGHTKPDTSGSVHQFSGTFGLKTEKSTVFGNHGGEKSQVSTSVSNPFQISNPFGRVNDAPKKSSNIFGGTVAGSSTVPRLFGEEIPAQKTKEAEQKKKSSEIPSPSSEDTVSSATLITSATSTPSLFGGVVTSPPLVSSTDSRPSPASPSSMYAVGHEEPLQIPRVFGGSATFSTSSGVVSTTVPKIIVTENKTTTLGESSASCNIVPNQVKVSKVFAPTSPFCGHPVGKTSTAVNVFGGTSSAAMSPGNTPTKSKKQTLPDNTETIKLNEKVAGNKTHQEPAEPNIVSKAKVIPELEKDEVPTSSSGIPTYHKKELTKIIIAQIPDRCMDKEILKNHFEKFGEVKRIMLNAKVNQATVQYNNHHAASKAKKKGKKIHPNLPEVKIFYGTPVRRKSEEGSSDAILSKKKAIKTLQQGQQASDLDPYTPLERPCGEKIKQVKRPINKEQFKKSTHLTVINKSNASKNKQNRPISPARETKESTISIEGKDTKVILDSQAVNNYDKFTILKTRDKLLRNERTRTSDLKKASYLAATCPDMCPELERYMRDIQNDLSFYETTNGSLDHRLVTKKFSRSSADKDVPLPHELRPGPVLLRTMDFLVCNIINRGDDEDTEVDVWYNYLWNRTRAIRNDLMQQQLTDSVAVTIMERCTRFHIHAAARLCQEPSDLFDPKMNTEHLTKSLQTLKELYHDLGERGEYFESEAEFRAYEMLLNLNDGETIVTQYSKFREVVQKSNHVQFALKVILAVTFNNYVKFFKLIRQATYLQGCVLHRYFRQVRSKALDTFMKAYVPTKTPQTVPLQTVIKTLGFENETDAVSYLKCHGVSVEEQNVVLDKSAFIQSPEDLPQLVRPITLIEVNRTCSVGEVIQGGPIPANPLHTHIPHCSFDDQGYLKPKAKDASDQKSENNQKTPPVLSPVLVVRQPERLQNYELLAQVKCVYNMIESSVFEEVLKQVSSECIELLQHEVSVEEATHAVNAQLLEEGIQEEVRTVSCEGISQVEQEEQEILRKQQEEEKKKQRALKELYDTVANSINTRFINEFTTDYIRKICQESIQEVEINATLENLMEELPSQYTKEVILEQLMKISSEVIEEMTAEQDAKMHDLQQKILLRKTRGYFRKWRVQALKSRRRKQSQEMFPADCSNLSIIQQNEAFGWGYQRSRTNNKSALQLARLESAISENMKKVTLRNQLMRECAWHPLFMQCLVLREVDKSIPPHNLFSQYFKVLICPSESCSSTVLQWVRAKLGTKENTDIQVPLNDSFSFTSKKSGIEYAWVMQEVSVSSLSAEDIKGTSALLFVTSCADPQDPQYCKIQELLAKNERVSWNSIFYNCEACNSEGWNLAEEELLLPETSLKLQSLILGFWKHQGTHMRLVSSFLNNFAYGFIAEKFVEPALCKQNERNEDGKSPIPPSAQIELYNKVIDFLIKAVNDEDLQNLEWPPPELSHLSQIPPPTWNNADARSVVNMLSHLKLPELRMAGIMSWRDITESLHTYVTKVSGSHDDGIRLVSHLNAILSNTLKILGPIHGYENGVCPDWKLHVLQLPWTELVYACVSFKLSGLPDTPVFYQPKKLESFTFPRSWWTACDTSDPEWAESVKENCPSHSRKRKAQQQIEPQSEPRKVKKAPSKFLDDIENEKYKCMEFEKKLEGMLEIDEELKFLFDTECW